MDAQIINLDRLEEQFGTELSKKIKIDIDWCCEQKEEFKIEILIQTLNSAKIAFLTDAYAKIYVVANKSLIEERMIGFYECERILHLMQEITKKEAVS